MCILCYTSEKIIGNIMVIVDKSMFVNLVALSRFTSYAWIGEDNCQDINLNEYVNLRKSINKHTFFYFIAFLALFMVTFLTKSTALTVIGGFAIAFLLIISSWAYIGFRSGRIKVDKRRFKREPGE